MKFLLTLLILVFGNQAFACDCSFSTPTNSFVASDFVGRIKILKVYPNQGKEQIYRADVQVVEHFKGPNLNFIYVYGRSDEKFGTSCSVFFPEGSDLLVTAHAKDDGRYVFGMCDYKINFKTNYRSKQRDLEFIRALSRYDNSITANYIPYISPNFTLFLKSKNGIVLKENFALFEVVLDDQVNPSQVEIIKGFGDELDVEIVKKLYQSTWKLNYYLESDKIDGAVKLIVAVYYYPAAEEYESFISIFAV